MNHKLDAAGDGLPTLKKSDVGELGRRVTEWLRKRGEIRPFRRTVSNKLKDRPR